MNLVMQFRKVRFACFFGAFLWTFFALACRCWGAAAGCARQARRSLSLKMTVLNVVVQVCNHPEIFERRATTAPFMFMRVHTPSLQPAFRILMCN